MDKKSGLLSIGEMSKYSGASIRSLRYYEQMNILTPAYTDESSGYRYYSVDQLHHVAMITFCIDVGIPLKKLAKMAGENEIINLRTILEQGKSLAESKLAKLKNGMKLFEIIERQMDLTEIYPKGQIYPRKIEEKYFYVHPCDKSNLNQLDIIKSYMEMPFGYDEFEGLTEFGVMCEHSPAGEKYFVFVEISKHLEINEEHKKIIPAGIYSCCIDENRQIDRAAEIFKEQLGDSYIAIETEIVADKYEMGKPFYSELRAV